MMSEKVVLDSHGKFLTDLLSIGAHHVLAKSDCLWDIILNTEHYQVLGVESRE